LKKRQLSYLPLGDFFSRLLRKILNPNELQGEGLFFRLQNIALKGLICKILPNKESLRPVAEPI